MNEKNESKIEKYLKIIKAVFVLTALVAGLSYHIYRSAVVYPREKQLYVKRRKSKEKDIISHGIKSISIVVNNDWKMARLARGYGWASVKKVYVNNKLIDPDTLYRKDLFIYKHCGAYYYIYDNSYRFEYTRHYIYYDSIVHSFSNMWCLYEVYDGGGQVKSRETSSHFKREWMEENIDQLPKCDDKK
ncbi:MAG TPA: hypothetical protein ENK91_05335 [Bacteroidetes bacterium]|nr:hypothetical protein [Bacteroidota bacterium]